jgi:hypothetical protein
VFVVFEISNFSRTEVGIFSRVEMARLVVNAFWNLFVHDNPSVTISYEVVDGVTGDVLYSTQDWNYKNIAYLRKLGIDSTRDKIKKIREP